MENSIEVKSGHVEMSAKMDAIGGALCKTQSELGAVSKNEKGYGYNYASLASTIEISKEVLFKNGLSVTQLVGQIDRDANVGTVTTILLHSSGQFIKTESSIPLIEMKGTNAAQSYGAIISYLRRYSLQAILNMASEDNDASSQKGAEKAKYAKPKTTAKPAVKAEVKKPASDRFKKKPAAKAKKEEF